MLTKTVQGITGRAAIASTSATILMLMILTVNLCGVGIAQDQDHDHDQNHVQDRDQDHDHDYVQVHAPRYWTPTTKTTFALTLTARAADATTTCIGLGRGMVEQNLPTQSCAGALGYIGLEQAGATLIQWGAHRLGMDRSRYWVVRTIYKIGPILGAVPNAVGAANNVRVLRAY